MQPLMCTMPFNADVHSILVRTPLCVRQAVAEDPGGGAALGRDEQLIESMLSLLQGPASLSLRGRAAALIAELNAEAFYRPFAQVSCVVCCHVLHQQYAREGNVHLSYAVCSSD